MKGDNKMNLNHVTMCEVVQRWIDVEMPAQKLRVTSVRSDKSDPYAEGFDVVLESLEEEKP